MPAITASRAAVAGPLSGASGGRRNFSLESPAHSLLLDDYPLRLRAVVAGRVVLDSTRASVLHETRHHIVPYVPLEDFDAELLPRSSTRTHCPYKGDASYWSVRVGDREIEDAVWAYEDPLEAASWLKGLAALRWDAADAWYVEGDRVLGPHLRDPYHRVDVWESDRSVRVLAAGRCVAESARPKLVHETSLPVRVYIPLADVAPGVLAASDTRTRCPYKGEARYLSLEVGDEHFADAAWTYEAPLPEAAKAAGHVCFMADGIEVELGEPPGGRRIQHEAAVRDQL